MGRVHHHQRQHTAGSLSQGHVAADAARETHALAIGKAALGMRAIDAEHVRVRMTREPGVLGTERSSRITPQIFQQLTM